MELTFKSYRDKVLGCWAGKNIGGVLGAPFECMRHVNDCLLYTSKRTEVLFNPHKSTFYKKYVEKSIDFFIV